MTYEFILFERREKVALISFNRPHVLNALSLGLIKNLEDVLGKCETDPEIHCLIIRGSEKVFSVGLDIQEMQNNQYNSAHFEKILKGVEKVKMCSKPLIAAVSGYALGGGCELAMMCDIIIASETAQFGQPEINLGTLPGLGGTQRLVRAVGKAKAMDICLTGRFINAQEAKDTGLVSRVVPQKDLQKEALTVAKKIASYSLPVVMRLKEAIGKAFEMSLEDGLTHERKLFLSSFFLEDQKEGMRAFVEKRKPDFKGK